ncbi:MAG: hypothetical protein ACE141_15115 [Bryobacteraceae bacterium]
MLQPGQQVTATLGAAQQHVYGLTATAGDLITIRLVQTSDSWEPWLDLYGPDGKAIAYGGSSTGSWLGSALTTKLTVTGSYRFVVKDMLGTNSGEYTIVWHRLSNPPTATRLECGQPVSVSVAPGQVVFFTFDGLAGDKVVLPLVSTGGDWIMYVELFGPSSPTYLAWYSGREPPVFDASLWESGPYTVIIRDWAGTQSGTFSLALQRLNRPCGATNINAGQQEFAPAGSLGSVAFYTFSGSAGDVVNIRMVAKEPGPPFLPSLDLWGPDGKRVKEQPQDVKLPQTGIYSLIVNARWGAASGYGLAWQKLSSPGNSVTVHCGQEVVSTHVPGQVDFYTFPGAPGDAVTAWVYPQDPTWSPSLALAGPSGTFKRHAHSDSGPSVRLDVTLTESGAHTLTVTDSEASAESDRYRLVWQYSNRSCEAPPPSPLSVTKVVMNRGGDTGPLTVTIHGSGFLPGAQAKLRRSGQPDVLGTLMTVLDGGWNLVATFDLTGKARGSWNAVVSNPDGQTAELADAFRIEGGVSNAPTATAVNSASFATNSPLAPRLIASVFGSGFDPSVSLFTVASFFPDTFVLPTEVSGVSLRIGGRPAAPFFVGVGAASGLAAGTFQINCQVPVELLPGVQPFEVRYNGAIVASGSVTIAEFDPAVYTFTQNGSGQAVAVNQDGTLNGDPSAPVIPGTAPRPAKRGSSIVVYGTGAGSDLRDFQTQEPLTLPTGWAAECSGQPLYSTAQTPTVTVGGAAAEVQFSGMAPCLVGLWQLNIKIPDNSAVGANVPLAITIGGRSANATTIAVN